MLPSSENGVLYEEAGSYFVAVCRSRIMIFSGVADVTFVLKCTRLLKPGSRVKALSDRSPSTSASRVTNKAGRNHCNPSEKPNSVSDTENVISASGKLYVL